MKNESFPQALQLTLFNRYPTNYQSNLFTESRQEFSELEKKIVTLVVNQLGNLSVQGKIQPEAGVIVTVPYAELTRQNHSVIAEAADTLSKKRISFKIDTEFLHITPFPTIRSKTTNGRRSIEIRINPDVVPHFAALGQRYTKYDLDIMLSLSSVYAQRLFEIVSMNLHIKKMQFTYAVDELRDILNCPATYRWNDFKVNILEVARRELQQKAQIWLDWLPTQKIGKRVVELEFQIKTAHQLASEGVQQDALSLSEMAPHELIIKGYEVMSVYQLKPWQKDVVTADMSLLETLFRVHSEFMNGLRPEVRNRNKYLAKSLGLDKLKAPLKKTQEPVSSTQLSFTAPVAETGRRTGGTQSIGNVIGNLIPRKETI